MRSYTADAVAISEFRVFLSKVRSENPGNLRLADFPVLNPVSDSECLNRYKVSKIQKPYFSELNDTYVYTYPGKVRRRLYVNGEMLHNKDGSVKYQDVTVPNSCVAVLSTKNIHLRNYVEVDGVQTEIRAYNEYQYVDYYDLTLTKSEPKPDGSGHITKEETQRYYIYIIPKEFLSPLDRMCLIASMTPRNAYYDGMRITTRKGQLLYLYITIFDKKYSKSVEGYEQTYRVLGLNPLGMESGFDSLKYLRKMRDTLLNLWCQVGLIFPPFLTQLSEPVKDIVNLAYKSEGNKKLDVADFELRQIPVEELEAEEELPEVELSKKEQKQLAEQKRAKEQLDFLASLDTDKE